jgi:predicted  nucleic acid-binding Zn-ribbon protein
MIHTLAAQSAGPQPAQRQAEAVVSALAPQSVSSGFDWMLLLQVIVSLAFVIVIGAFIWWLVRTLAQLGEQLGVLSSKLDFILPRLAKPQTPTSAPQHAPSGDVLVNFNKALDSATKLLEPIAVSSQKMQEVEVALAGLKTRLEVLLSVIEEKEKGLSADKAEFARLRSANPALELTIKGLEQEREKLQVELSSEKNRLVAAHNELDSEKAAHGFTRSGLEGRLSERAAELSLVQRDFSSLAAELEVVRGDLAATQARRDELSAEADRLNAQIVELKSGLSASLAKHESFVDWVLTKEVREMFAEELGGVLASKTDHELLSSLAMLKDAGSDLSDESVVLANIRHLGELLVRFYRSQGLDAGQRDAKLRKWADFVNSKAARHAQVIVPGLRFPVNAAVMVAPDGVKVISDVHCWQVNNVKGVVYAPAKVS